MVGSADPILDLLPSIEKVEDLDSLKKIVRRAVQASGYDRIMMFSIAATKDDLLQGVYWAEGRWFDDGEALNAETYIRHCPVTRHILESDQPFFWTKLQTKKGKRYRFVTSPFGPGLHGLQVPVFAHTGLVGAVCFGGERIDHMPRTRFALTQLGQTAFFAARVLLEPTKPAYKTKLSERELEVLQWIASGQRIADTAATLGLSERTVENHLRRIRQRLQVKTTSQAIGAALGSGLVKV